MNLKPFRIISLIASIFIIISAIIFLGLNIEHYKDESLITLLGLLMIIAIGTIEFVVSIKSFKKESSMVNALFFERDGTINKVPLVVIIIFFILAITSTAFGIYYLISLNYDYGIFFTELGIFIILNVIIYFAYLFPNRKRY